MTDLSAYGFIPSMTDDPHGTPARVTAVHRERFELITEQGLKSGRLKAAEYYAGTETFPTAGDFVLIDNTDMDECRILKTLPRKSYFSRLDPSSSGHGEQAVAANFDYVFIMQSLNHNFNINRLNRYLTLAWQSGAVPAVLLTKSDAAGDYSEMKRAAESAAVGVGVYAVSSVTGEGLTQLSEYLKPKKTIVFLGSSGVGKSSLVNALAGGDVMVTNEIREEDSRGRHTTTHRQLLLLPSGVMIIDTPGMRELGMWDVTEGLGQSFSDVEKYTGSCRFSDCTHTNEPGCAVTAAIAAGELSKKRLEAYKSLAGEAKYSENKTEYLRKKQQWHKSIAVANKERNKNGGKRG